MEVQSSQAAPAPHGTLTAQREVAERSLTLGSSLYRRHHKLDTLVTVERDRRRGSEVARRPSRWAPRRRRPAARWPTSSTAAHRQQRPSSDRPTGRGWLRALGPQGRPQGASPSRAAACPLLPPLLPALGDPNSVLPTHAQGELPQNADVLGLGRTGKNSRGTHHRSKPVGLRGSRRRHLP